MLGYGMIFVLLLLLAFLILLAAIGIYVYRDAKDRRMNALLWTLVAVVAPFLTGFIVYLIVRGAHPNLRCPHCGTSVTERFLVCPSCGAKLRHVCPSCSFPVEEGWKVCPRCAAQLPEDGEAITPPRQKKDRALGKILAAIILVPLVLFALNLLLLTASPFGGGEAGGVGVTTMEAGDYLQTMLNPEIESWLQESQSGAADAYALRYETGEGDERRVEYLVYVPAWASDASLSVGQTSDFFGRYVEIDCKNNGGGSESFLIVSGDGDPLPQLRLSFGGRPVSCEVREVDFPLDPDA